MAAKRTTTPPSSLLVRTAVSGRRWSSTSIWPGESEPVSRIHKEVGDHVELVDVEEDRDYWTG